MNWFQSLAALGLGEERDSTTQLVLSCAERNCPILFYRSNPYHLLPTSSRCLGDMRLRNQVLLEGRPTASERDDQSRSNEDVLCRPTGSILLL